MHYTIASLRDMQLQMGIELSKSGNKYQVSIHDNESGSFVHKDYKNHTDACAVFENLTKAVITGCYSYEQRKAMMV